MLKSGGSIDFPDEDGVTFNHPHVIGEDDIVGSLPSVSERKQKFMLETIMSGSNIGLDGRPPAASTGSVSTEKNSIAEMSASSSHGDFSAR